MKQNSKNCLLISIKANCFAIGACTFESDECGFSQSKTDDFNWLRKKGTTSSYNTGPTIDHSTGLCSGKLQLLYSVQFKKM